MWLGSERPNFRLSKYNDPMDTTHINQLNILPKAF